MNLLDYTIHAVRFHEPDLRTPESRLKRLSMVARPFALPFPLVLLVLVILSVLVRGAVMAGGAVPFDDPDNYLPLARSLAAGDGFSLAGHPTAYRPPLYPLMLAPLISVLGSRAMWGIALLHLGLGAGTVLLTALAAKGSGLSPSRVLVAAFLTACDPVLIWQSRSVMTETPAAFLIAFILAVLTVKGWRGPVLGGVGFGLAALCRPSVLAGAILVILAGFLAKPGSFACRAVRGGLLSVVLMLVLLPWIVRNLYVFGEPIATTTHGGYTLALANNPVYYRQVLDGPPDRVWSGRDQWLWWDSVNTATAGMSATEADRYLSTTVWRLAQEQPAAFLRASGARLRRFWGLAPAASVYSGPIRWGAIAWTVPLWIALILGIAQPDQWRWPRISAPLIVVGLSLVHAVFWTDLRMRAPIVPAIVLIAAGAAWPRRVEAGRS